MFVELYVIFIILASFILCSLLLVMLLNDKDKEIFKLRRRAGNLEKCVGTSVIVTADGTTIIDGWEKED